MELILSTHEKKCLSCVRSTNCELQKLCRDYGVEESAFEGFKPTYELDTSTPHLVRDNNKCVLCRRCVAACNEQYVWRYRRERPRLLTRHIGTRV